ncbi:hypothetical protein BH10PSE19_BH10PSE19_11450 [soil metagenome]
MNLKLSASNNNYMPPPFLPGWLILVFVLCCIILSIVLFPYFQLTRYIYSEAKYEPIALFYLERFSKVYPTNKKVKMALIKQQIAASNFTVATQEVANLEKLNQQINDPFLSTQLVWLKLQLLLGKIYTPGVYGEQRDIWIHEASILVTTLSALSLDMPQMQQLAQQAYGLNLPKVTLKLYLRINENETIHDIKMIFYVAKVAHSAGEYAIAGDYYFRAAKSVPNIVEKRQYVMDGLTVYREGGLMNNGLQQLNAVPVQILQDKKMLNYLIEYALAANQPALAEKYLKMLLLITK